MGVDHISRPERLPAPNEDLRPRRVEGHQRAQPVSESKEDRWEGSSDQQSGRSPAEPDGDAQEEAGAVGRAYPCPPDAEREEEEANPTASHHFDERA
jgi:hypothetical protein